MALAPTPATQPQNPLLYTLETQVLRTGDQGRGRVKNNVFKKHLSTSHYWV